MRLALVGLALALLSVAVLPAQEGKAVEAEYAPVFYLLREGSLSIATACMSMTCGARSQLDWAWRTVWRVRGSKPRTTIT